VQKRAKIGTIYDNFRVLAQMSLESMNIPTISKWRWRERSFRRWTRKNLQNSVHYKQSYKRSAEKVSICIVIEMLMHITN